MESKVKEIFLKNGILEKISEVLVVDPGLRNGMASQNKFITVKFQNRDIPERHLFAKTETGNESQNEMIRDLQAFEKEAQFFTEYVPLAGKLCRDKGQDKLMDIYPKCYYADDKLLLLENLTLEKGFSLFEGMHDLEVAKISLLTLAKHHAISYCCIEEAGGREKFFETFSYLNSNAIWKPSVRGMIEPMIINGVLNGKKLLQKINVEGGDETLEKLNALNKDEIYDKIGKMWEDSDYPVLALLHGDYWNNNMMFKMDKKSGKIVGHKAIDFQGITYNTPAIDLGYYMFSNLQPEVRQQELNILLQFYLDSFKDIVKELGHHVELSFEELFIQFRKVFKFGYWIWFSVNSGPGKDVIQDMDLSELKDMSDLQTLFDEAVQRWIDREPENGEKLVKNIVSLTRELSQLELD